MIRLVNTENDKIICEGKDNIIKFFEPVFKNNNMVNKEVEENQIILINKYTNKKIVYLLEYDNKRDYYNTINKLLADYIKDKIIDEFVK